MILASGSLEAWHIVAGVGSLIFFGVMLAILQQLRTFIRQQAGITETTETKITPQPLTVKPVVRMATFDELQQVQKSVEKLDEDIGEMQKKLDVDFEKVRSESAESERRLQVEASRRASSLHQRMDNFKGTLERLDERSEITHTTVTSLNETVLELLKNRLK